MMSKKRFLKTLCAGLLVFTFVFAPVSFNAEERVSLNTAEAIIPTASFDPATWWLMIKEQILDGIVWEIRNILLEELVKSMTDWVRGGFRGSPAFVTDIGGFMEGVSDQVQMAFIDGTPLEDLCSPFYFQVRAGLDLAYSNTTRYKAGCTLDDIVNNIDDFVDGDFYAGGWDGWAAMTFDEENNFYGSSFKAQAGLDAAIRTSTGEELAYLSFGSGYFGQEKCNEDGECYRVTPGETVNEALNNALNLGNNSVDLADEFNELFGALLSQLVGQVIGKDTGLAGFDASRAEPDTTFTDEARRINDEANTGAQQGSSERQETLRILSGAAEYCRNEFNRPLSQDLTDAGWGDSGVDPDDLQDRANEYMDNGCEELP